MNIFYFHPDFGEMIQFDKHIFQMGWFNHQLDMIYQSPTPTPFSDKIFFLDLHLSNNTM